MRRKMLTAQWCLLAGVAAVCFASGCSLEETGAEPGLKTPRLLVQLPAFCPTPDGLALDAEGNVVLACPNFADKTFPAVFMRIDRLNKATLWFEAPKHVATGVGCPMGIAFGPDGDLFICDNQDWGKAESKNQGRVLRVKLRDGKPAETVVVAHGMNHPNGIRVHKGHLYVTQSLLPAIGQNPLVSGVYRFKIDDTGVKITNSLADKTLLTTFKTLNPACQYGADGLVFSSKGDLYVGNFGDATLHKITFDEAGNVASNTVFARADCMKSIDGICVDDSDTIYVADFSNNAVCVVSPDGAVRVLAKSPDCDGSQGGLDQPGEPLIRGREVIVSNFDNVAGPDKVNTKHDAPFTLSVISLDD